MCRQRGSMDGSVILKQAPRNSSRALKSIGHSGQTVSLQHRVMHTASKLFSRYSLYFFFFKHHNPQSWSTAVQEQLESLKRASGSVSCSCWMCRTMQRAGLCGRRWCYSWEVECLFVFMHHWAVFKGTIWTLGSDTVSEFPLNRSVFPGVSALLIVERLFANVSIQIRLMDLHFFSAFPVCWPLTGLYNPSPLTLAC